MIAENHNWSQFVDGFTYRDGCEQTRASALLHIAGQKVV